MAPNQVWGPLGYVALASLPPLPPMLGSGKVAKCHRGHCSNKSSLVQHLQARGAPLSYPPPTPAPLTKHLLSWPSEDASVPLKRPRKPRRGPPGEARAPGGGPGARSFFLPGSYFSSLVGVPQSLSFWLHSHIKTSRKKKPSRKNY